MMGTNIINNLERIEIEEAIAALESVSSGLFEEEIKNIKIKLEELQ